MITSSIRHSSSLLIAPASKRVNHIASFGCLHGRNVHSTPQQNSTAETTPVVMKEEAKESSGLANRFTVTGEVIISKIFPAGFGWQSSSILAENYLGYAPDTAAFAFTTGMGDAVGVMLGHCGYYAIKKSVTGNEKIHMKREIDTGLLLSSAAFCSGSLWQPLVDVLQGANLPFSTALCGTWIGCGTAFYAGLRIGRTVFPSLLEYVEEPTYENSKTDASLSIAIGGATGFFVGTDAAYLPAENFLIEIVGITDSTPDLMGCAIAGSSTALGFGVAQTGLNMVYPAKKCWND